MNRLQKKCFIASTGLHLLLVIILFIGPAFLGSKEKQAAPTQYIDVIPKNIIEGAFVGGGNPNAKPPPPAPLVQTPPVQPAATPPPPKSAPPEPVKEVKPPKEDPDSLEASDKPRKPQINTQAIVTRKNNQTRTSSNESSKETSQSQAQERANAERLAKVQGILQSLKEGRSSGTTIDIQGPGGEAYAGYETVLQSIYKRYYDEALSAASDVGDGTAATEVVVTVERSGNVTASRIVTPSGNAGLDRVVKRVLSRVTYIRPFPEGAKDSVRTFNIIFDLKTKRAIG